MTARGQGLVLSRYGSMVMLALEDGRTQKIPVRRKLQGIVCGDRVHWETDARGSYVVTDILPRKNTLVRSYFRGQPRLIAANVDQIVIVAATEPEPDWSLIDNLLVTANTMQADAMILHNKSDLPATPEQDKNFLEYQAIGYPVLKTSTAIPDSIAALEAKLKDKVNVFVGQSGVGKSSLTNLLIPQAAVKTQSISEISKLGQHTTSMATLYSLPQGGALIDSPGIRDFTPMPLPISEYQYGFVEFQPYREHCRFHNCIHHKEPGCAVRQAVEDGKISQRRYTGYLNLMTATP